MWRLISITILCSAVLILAPIGLYLWLYHDYMQGESMIQTEDHFSPISCSQYIAARSVWAAELTLTPALELTQEYNDNILFAEENKVKDTVTKTTPKFHASLAGEDYSFTAGGLLRVREYWEKNDLDTVDLSTDLSAALQLTPRLGTRGSGSYLKDTTLESELEATGLVLSQRNRRRRHGAAGLNYLIDDRTALDFDAGHTRVEYEDPGLVDYTANGVDLALARSMKDKRGTATAHFHVTDYRYRPNEYQDYGLALGYLYRFTERSALDVAAGMRLTQSHIETLTDTTREKSWGGLGNLVLSWESKKASARLGYVRELTASGLGEPIDKNRIYVTVSHRFSERFTGEVYSEYFDSKSVGDFTRIDEKFFRVRPSLRVRLSERIWAQLAYEYARSRNELSNADAVRNRVYLTLSGAWPRKHRFP